MQNPPQNLKKNHIFFIRKKTIFKSLCGHISLEIYVRTMSAQHLPRETYILREMLCGHSADIVRTYI